jgi:hypothetical protein
LPEILIRVVVGGVVVSLFAILGDVLKPKSFAGLFGAAPSVALATLSLTISKDGRAYASMEARSMIWGGLAFVIYAYVVCRLLARGTRGALAVTSLSLTLWLACAFAFWGIFLQ